MDRDLCIKVWGARGTFPAPLPDRMGYGGNTVCISIELSDRIMVMDAGTGLAPLGQWIAEGGRYRRVDLFISHLHLDHILGLFQFRPFFEPDMEIHLYGAPWGGRALREQLETLIGPPWWPVGMAQFAAKLVWHDVEAGVIVREPWGLEFTAEQASHPGGSLMYRFRLGGKSLMYGLDCEMDDSVWERLVSLSRGCGLLICDGYFQPGNVKEGWGHSSWEQAVRLRRESGAERVMVTHYAWECTDRVLSQWEKMAGDGSGCIFAREGMEVIV